MEVGVLFTNYQAWPLTEHAIKEVLRWSGSSISRIVVVDDASDAPREFPDSAKVVIHRNAHNLGYVRSVNIGMGLMIEDLVLLLDCDAYPLMDLVPGVFKHFADDPLLGALGFFELGVGGKTRITGEREPTLSHFLLGQKLGARLARRGWLAGKRLVLHSCCMAVRRTAFESVGGFDEHFDFLDADTDFSIRLQDAGWSVEADPALRCFHQGSGSPQTRALRVRRFHANRWLLLRKHRVIRLTLLYKLILFLRHVAEFFVLQASCLLPFKHRGEYRDSVAGRIFLLRRVWKNYSHQD